MAKSSKSESQVRREQRRLQHQDLSRAQLLDAAEEVFGRKGFHETTLKEVADLAGFSVGSVYSFFESKDDLFRQILLRRGGEFMQGMGELLSDEQQPANEQLLDLARFQVGFFRTYPNFGRLYLRYASVATLAALSDQIDVEVSDRYEQAMGMQAELFHRGQKSGALCEGDPVVLSRLFSGLVATFQAVDPAVVTDDGDPDEAPVEDFLSLVSRAFSRD